MADRDDVRDRLKRGLEDHLTDQQITKLFEEVLALTKQSRGWCKECKHAVFVEIPDAKAVTSALMDLSNRAFGTPGKAPDPEPEIEDQYVEVDFSTLTDEDLRKLAA